MNNNRKGIRWVRFALVLIISGIVGGVIGLVIMLAYSYIVARILAVQKITDVYNKVMDRLNAAVFRSKEAAAVK